MKKVIIIISVLMLLLSPLTVYAASPSIDNYYYVPLDVIEFFEPIYEQYSGSLVPYSLAYVTSVDSYHMYQMVISRDLWYDEDTMSVNCTSAWVFDLYLFYDNDDPDFVETQLTYDFYEGDLEFYANYDVFLGSSDVALYDPYYGTVDYGFYLDVFSTVAIISILLIILFKIGVKKK